MRKQKSLKIRTPNKSCSLVIYPNNSFTNKNDTFGKVGYFLSEYHFQVNKFDGMFLALDQSSSLVFQFRKNI